MKNKPHPIPYDTIASNRWKLTAARMGKNLVIGSKAGIPQIGYYTPAKSIKEFLTRNPKAKKIGFDLTLVKTSQEGTW